MQLLRHRDEIPQLPELNRSVHRSPNTYSRRRRAPPSRLGQTQPRGRTGSRIPTRTRMQDGSTAEANDPRFAKLETHGVAGSPAAVVAQLGVVLRRELGCNRGAVEAAAEALADRSTRAGSKHRGAVALVTDQAPARALRALPGWMICTTVDVPSRAPSADFPKSSKRAALIAPGEAPATPTTRQSRPGSSDSSFASPSASLAGEAQLSAPIRPIHKPARGRRRLPLGLAAPLSGGSVLAGRASRRRTRP